MDDFVGPLVEEVTGMPEVWSGALTAVKSGMSDVLTIVTGDTLLLAMTFGFVFIRKGIGVVKKLVRIGGKS